MDRLRVLTEDGQAQSPEALFAEIALNRESIVELTNQVDFLSKKLDDLLSVLANLETPSDALVQAMPLRSFDDSPAEQSTAPMPTIASVSETGELTDGDRHTLNEFLHECIEARRIDSEALVTMRLLHVDMTATNTRAIADVMALVKRIMGDLGYRTTEDLRLVGGPGKQDDQPTETRS